MEATPISLVKEENRWCLSMLVRQALHIEASGGNIEGDYLFDIEEIWWDFQMDLWVQSMRANGKACSAMGM